MAMPESEAPNPTPKITIQTDGPYIVHGSVPLVQKQQVVSEHGEPLAWEKTGELEHRKTYALCRCGQSAHKPLCDGSHKP